VTKRLRPFLLVALSTGLASAVSLIGGLGLEHISRQLLPLVPLLVALPGLNDLVGDYASIIAAHTGDPQERQRSHRELSRAIFRVVGLNISAIVALSLILSALRGYVVTADFAWRFALLVVIAIITVITFMFWLNRVLDRLLLKHKYNPDDLLIPISTSVADILMLTIVTASVVLLFG
jgi:cation transporter-like permease